VLIDGYGSKELSRTIVEDLRAKGVKVLIYRPKISPWTCRRKRLRRLHRKIAVVDRELAFVGGLNIIDDRETRDDIHPRYDYAVAVEGPLVDVIARSTMRLWSMVAWSYFRKGTFRDEALTVAPSAGGAMSAAFLVRDNVRHRRDIETAYMKAIESAKDEIIIANAYFLPGGEFRHALVDAAGRGVRVVLLLQGRVEYFLQHYAARALYGNFLDAGIEIYEYGKSFLHAKVAVIDGHWSTVGSSNIDPFSLLLSREANVVVDDKGFGASLTASLKQTMEADGRRIVKDNWMQQPVYFRFVSWLSYGLVRAMMGIAGYDPENKPAGNDRREEPEE
jgi:cardiolipin synthase